jgi:hypothetical protein
MGLGDTFGIGEVTSDVEMAVESSRRLGGDLNGVSTADEFSPVFA